MKDTCIRVCVVVEAGENGLGRLEIKDVRQPRSKDPLTFHVYLSFGMNDVEAHLAIDREHWLVDVRLSSVRCQ